MITPKSEAELSSLLKEAQTPFHVIGGGTRPIGAPVKGDTLSTRKLNGISIYEPGALTLVAQAGTPVADIEKTLTKENQRLAFEPMDHRSLLGTKGTPTIGGVIAANVSGPRRIQVGAARDFLLGTRFVDGQGMITHNGGRVMKNVTGYDLSRLMSGSFGTLGVLTEVALKVLPSPETTATMILHELTDIDAIKALSAALGSPFDVSGVAHVRDAKTSMTYLRVEGFEASVNYRLEALKSLLAAFGGIEIDHKAKNIWSDIRDVKLFHGSRKDIWRISVKPSDAPSVVDAVQADKALYDWGGGLIWLALDPAKSTGLRNVVSQIGGHATLMRGTSDGAFEPQNVALIKLEQGIRSRFDPKGILNPGLMRPAA